MKMSKDKNKKNNPSNTVDKKANNAKVICVNKKAGFNYTLENGMEAGISLLGTEVKSLRLGGGSLVDCHAGFDNDGLVLFNFRVSTYKFAPIDKQHEPTRNKRLLMNKYELKKLRGQIKTKGYTLVPTKVYFNKRGMVKVEICLALGKKLHDKRETIKIRDLDRESRKIGSKFE